MRLDPSPHPTSSPRGGFTLLEAIIVGVVLAMVVLIAAQSLESGSRLNERISIEADLQQRADDVLGALSLELRTASTSMHGGGADLVVGPDAPAASASSVRTETDVGATYDYRISTGIEPCLESTIDAPGGAAVLHQSFRCAYEPGWHRLIFTRGSAGTGSGTLVKQVFADRGRTNLVSSELLCDHIAAVDPADPRLGGFSIHRDGNALTLRLALQAAGEAPSASATARDGGDARVVRCVDSRVVFLRSTLDAREDRSALDVLAGSGTGSERP